MYFIASSSCGVPSSKRGGGGRKGLPQLARGVRSEVQVLPDAATFAGLLHAFNVEFDAPTPDAGTIAAWAAPLLASGEVTVLFAGDDAGRLRAAPLPPLALQGALDAHLEELYVVPECRGRPGTSTCSKGRWSSRASAAPPTSTSGRARTTLAARPLRARASLTARAGRTGRGCSTTSAISSVGDADPDGEQGDGEPDTADDEDPRIPATPAGCCRSTARSRRCPATRSAPRAASARSSRTPRPRRGTSRARRRRASSPPWASRHAPAAP